MIKIGALWLQTSKDGKKFMTGNFGDAKLVVMKNDYKTTDNHPDYIVYIAEVQKDSRTPKERKEDKRL